MFLYFTLKKTITEVIFLKYTFYNKIVLFLEKNTEMIFLLLYLEMKIIIIYFFLKFKKHYSRDMHWTNPFLWKKHRVKYRGKLETILEHRAAPTKYLGELLTFKINEKLFKIGERTR